ncbi:hypothetical protein BDV95DRAFT_496366 [Massariosphaeria phaeospora]|uniref:DUF6536 domain-containing protein n=1 Tax=Massariosphaeria phaeospora TaxID=100035 RepID=A0A7C8M8N9_9PLEO|nr:hypothetical protein BDV95DRAFT_496366 [Massariosphaeria phaeospora]
MGAAKYTISHRKTLVERLEGFEQRRFGTRLSGFLYDTFIAGWRAGLLRAFLFSLLALVVNVAIYAWLFATHNSAKSNNTTIMTGSCRMIRGANTGIHVALNAVSTMILGASTYAMQGMTAPTRKEVDAAHLQGRWVEIGTSSVRNLFYVRRMNTCIWGFFNAVFFTTTQANQYAVAAVDQSYFRNTCSFDVRNASAVVNLLQDVRDVSKSAEFVRMEPLECMQIYTSGFMQLYGDVVVVSSRSDVDSPIIWTRYPQRSLGTPQMATHPDPFHWVCHDLLGSDSRICSLDISLDYFNSGGNWTVYHNPVDYCMARVIPDTCQLQFNEFLMLAVVIFSAIKVIIVGYLALSRPADRFLRTLGDAIASFLEKEDPTTKHMCLVSSVQVRKHGFQTPFEPQAFTGRRPRWLNCANSTEFFSTIGVSAMYIVVISIALFFAVDRANGTAFSNALGVPDIQSLSAFKRDDVGSSGIVPTLLMANIPQVGFSILYVVYTNLWQKMMVAQEFDGFTQAKKGLRVSVRPRGKQRATRFFTLPARYALPLMTCSTALHWLCSQSLFMVRIDGVNAHREVDTMDRIVRLGYSATGVVALIGVSAGMMVVTVCVGVFRRMRTELGETSMSVVISAACHVARNEPEPWLQEVQWGDVTSDAEDRASTEHSVRHCAFTTLRTEVPRKEHLYR